MRKFTGAEKRDAMPMKYVHLFARYARLSFLRAMEYKIPLFVEVCADVFSVAVTLLFWGAIFSMTTNINGWNFGQIMLLQGFFNAFIVMFWLLFAGSRRLNREILEGKLDRHLARPVNPILMHMFENIEFFIFDDLFRAVAFFAAAFAYGVQIAALNMLVSFVFVMIAAIAVTLMFLTIECSAFWLGRVDASHKLFDFFWTVGGYPTVIFPMGVQFIFTFILPVFFLQTYPALFTAQVIGWESFWQYFAFAFVSILLWFAVFCFVWKKGLKRYESHGG